MLTNILQNKAGIIIWCKFLALEKCVEDMGGYAWHMITYDDKKLTIIISDCCLGALQVVKHDQRCQSLIIFLATWAIIALCCLHHMTCCSHCVISPICHNSWSLWIDSCLLTPFGVYLMTSDSLTPQEIKSIHIEIKIDYSYYTIHWIYEGIPICDLNHNHLALSIFCILYERQLLFEFL